MLIESCSEVVFNRNAEKFVSELADLARNEVALMCGDTILLLLWKIINGRCSFDVYQGSSTKI
jgi:hypothetical protein